MNFQVGKKYPMRNGEAAEIISIVPEEYVMMVKIPDGRQLWARTDGMQASVILSDYDIISDTPIEEPTRRQFDVSKLKTPAYLNVQENARYMVKYQVLEAWNAGTIEELLKGWVGE